MKKTIQEIICKTSGGWGKTLSFLFAAFFGFAICGICAATNTNISNRKFVKEGGVLVVSYSTTLGMLMPRKAGV